MDKNMINIDDLFKQRFNREEEERGGAWLRMRDLLDDRMPANVPVAGINWRRMLSYVAGIALLATVTVGGYEVATKSRSNDESARLASTVAGVPAHRSLAGRTAGELMTAKDKAAADKSSSSNSGANISGTLASTVADNDNNGLNKTVNKTLINNTKSADYNKVEHHIQTAKHSTNTKGGTSEVADNHGDKSNVNGVMQAGAGSLTGNNDADINKVTENTTGTRHSNHGYAHANKLTLASGSVTPNNKLGGASKNLNNNNLDGGNNNSSNHSSGLMAGNDHKHVRSHKTRNINALMPASGSIVSNFGNVPTTVAADNTSNAIARVETIEALEIKQRLIVDPETHRATYRNDTIGKLPVQKFVFAPIDDNTPGSLKENSNKGYAANSKGKKSNDADNELKPGAASNNAAANSNSEKSDLAKKRAASDRWDWRSMSEALKDFEYNLGQVKVFPGVIGGVNTTFFGPSSSSTGFHLGMTTEFEFNDHWGMMAELKYMQRANNGVLNNNYVSYKAIDSSGTPQHMAYVIQKDSIQHYFNYSTLHSLEMPISLHYKAGNFNIFVGGNLVYNFAINTEEIDHKYLTAPTTETFPGNNWQSVLKNSPKYTINDFSSIFGIGYLLGLSYEFTPSIMVDARMTQMVWDNAKTLGAKQISTNLYQSPSAQLSIIYRLNHKKTEVYDK